MELVQLNEDDYDLDFEADLRAQDAWRESQLMQETGGLGSMARGILRPGGRHTIVCRHWLRDLCMKGDKCDFLHQYDLARMPECAQWSRFGKCPDNDCDFRHDTEKMECQKYKFGFCKLGSQCKMRHDKLSRNYLPETAPDWFLKEIIPNFFDFVPKLPEEIIRVSGTDDAPPLQPGPLVPPVQGPGFWQTAPPQPAHGTDLNWAAPSMPSWNTRPQAQQSAWQAAPKPVVDLTDDRRGSRRQQDQGADVKAVNTKRSVDTRHRERTDDSRRGGEERPPRGNIDNRQRERLDDSRRHGEERSDRGHVEARSREKFDGSRRHDEGRSARPAPVREEARDRRDRGDARDGREDVRSRDQREQIRSTRTEDVETRGRSARKLDETRRDEGADRNRVRRDDEPYRDRSRDRRRSRSHERARDDRGRGRR
jgi:hypothetical protein